MRAWTRANSQTKCGSCRNRTILEGDPLLLITIHKGRPLKRCIECAGPAPPDLPPYVSTKKEYGDFTSIGSVRPNTKTRGQFREAVKGWTPYREPGSDDE